jgi:membrane associated rhomboid family serine protease
MLFFPIGDVNVENGHRPIFARALLFINIAVFIYQFSLGEAGFRNFINTYGLIPSEFVKGEDWFTAWTSMFMHAGWMHLIGNMFFLYVFADNIEARIGTIKFIMFYFLGGLAAALGQTIFNIESVIPMVGASGCISACLGAYLVMFPKNKVKLLLIVFVVNVPAFLFLGFWTLQQFAAGYGSFVKTQDTGGVAYFAHIGGLILGLIAGLIFRKMKRTYIVS